jgi:predicted nucleic acid-binding protein
MISFDTNIAVHAANRASSAHRPAVEFLQSIASRRNVAVCELMLVELYLKLRNEKIFPHPLTASQAVAVCHAYRKNQARSLIDCAPVMETVWAQAGQRHAKPHHPKKENENGENPGKPCATKNCASVGCNPISSSRSNGISLGIKALEQIRRFHFPI